jgi:hypothetical protein
VQGRKALSAHSAEVPNSEQDSKEQVVFTVVPHRFPALSFPTLFPFSVRVKDCELSQRLIAVLRPGAQVGA